MKGLEESAKTAVGREQAKTNEDFQAIKILASGLPLLVFLPLIHRRILKAQTL